MLAAPALLAARAFPPAAVSLNEHECAPVGRQNRHVEVVFAVVHAVQAGNLARLLDGAVVVVVEQHGQQLEALRLDGRPAPLEIVLVVDDKELVGVLVLLVKVAPSRSSAIQVGGGGGGGGVVIVGADTCAGTVGGCCCGCDPGPLLLSGVCVVIVVVAVEVMVMMVVVAVVSR